MEVLMLPITILFICIIVMSLLLAAFFGWVAQQDGGTKGISKEEYTSPSGKKRTAKKTREDHIV